VPAGESQDGVAPSQAPEAGARLELALCSTCALVQIAGSAEVVELLRRREARSAPREVNFRYQPALPAQIVASQKLRPTSLVIDVGSGDGRLLEWYQHAGIPVLGIEPAVNLAEAARHERNVPTLAKFFNPDLAAQLEACGQSADVVHVHRVLECVLDPNGLVAGLKIVLKPAGVAVIESTYVKDLIDGVAGVAGTPANFLQSRYFSLTSLANLLSRHSLTIHDVERPAKSGSLRLFVGRSSGSSTRLRMLLDEEAAWGVSRPQTYLNFARRAAAHWQQLVASGDRPGGPRVAVDAA
jgi:2-polyprenyl-3-methyl-5-hydroxy-6-metoxy-1,4-benzoquinol methylase